MPLSLRVVTWNLHKCVGGLDRRHDVQRCAAVLADMAPDIALLQEVAQNGKRFGSAKQVDELAQRLGFEHQSYFVNVRFGPRRGEYGNAVLSRFPIVRTENIDLTLPGRKARSVLHAELRLLNKQGHQRTLHTFNLHLGLSERERREQLARFLACAPLRAVHASTPVVVAGDFNDVWGSLGKRLLLPAGFCGPRRPVRTFPAWAPMRALDSLYLRGDCELDSLTKLRGKGARTASDHAPLLAEIVIHTAWSGR